MNKNEHWVCKKLKIVYKNHLLLDFMWRAKIWEGVGVKTDNIIDLKNLKIDI